MANPARLCTILLGGYIAQVAGTGLKALPMTVILIFKSMQQECIQQETKKKENASIQNANQTCHMQKYIFILRFHTESTKTP